MASDNIQITKLEVKIDCDGMSNIVNRIYFTYKDGQQYIGGVGLPNAENFTAFENLTEQTVLSWLNVEEALSSRCSDSLPPICELKGLPW